MSELQRDTVNMPSAGKWTWNDETQTLEYTCFNISAGLKKKRKASKTPSYQELVREHLINLTIEIQNIGDKIVDTLDTAVDLTHLGQKGISQCMSPAKGGSSGLRNSTGLAELNAYKAAGSSQRDSIILEDIKQVAVSLMQEKEGLPIPLGFLTVIKSKEMDEFLAALLLYLHCYWQMKTLEERSKPLMVEQSVTEQQMTAEASVKLELAKKHLAVCYSSLVLGQGLSQQHHMACGRRRVSSTYRDRHLYECLYSFFCYVGWVTFGRENLKGIQTQISRLLRPDTFNPALRVQRNEPEEEDDEQEFSQKESQPETVPSIRKSQHKPGLISMLTQCSPVLTSILPSTREKAANLFQSSRLHNQQPDKLIDTDVLMEELSQQLASCSFGIIGKPLSHLRHSRLVSHGAKKEDEEADNEDHVDDDDDIDEDDNQLTNSRSRKMFMHQRSATMTAGKHSSLSRAYTVTSRATTEAPLSDSE